MLSALASAVLPGLGQLRNGERRKGAVLLAASLLLIGGAVFMLWRRPVTLLTWGVQPTALGWLLIGNGALLAMRVYAAADAYRRLRPPFTPWRRAGTAVLGGAVAAILLLPHAASGYGLILDKDLLTTVFVGSPAPAPTTLAPPPTSISPGDTSEPGAASTTSVATTTTTTTTIPPRLWDGVERLNVLLLGGDAGVGRTGVRTDTIILASLDPASGDIGLFAVPRNLVQVPLPRDLGIWACDCFPAIINELWDYGERNPERFAGVRPPGAAALAAGVEELTGIPVHNFALVSLDGFVDLVDALGGVQITVTERVFDSAYPHEDGTVEVIDIQPGTYHMDGHLALAYARSRQGSDDYNRMGRQRCLLEAVAAQADVVTIARSFANITDTIKNSMLTDIPLERLPDIVQIIPKVDTDRVVALAFEPPGYTAGRDASFYPIPDVATIQNAVDIVVSLPAAEAIAVLGLQPLSEECG